MPCVHSREKAWVLMEPDRLCCHSGCGSNFTNPHGASFASSGPIAFQLSSALALVEAVFSRSPGRCLPAIFSRHEPMNLTFPLSGRSKMG